MTGNNINVSAYIKEILSTSKQILNKVDNIGKMLVQLNNKTNVSNNVNNENWLDYVRKNPVPNITEKQIVIMSNRKYPLTYVEAVTGMKREEIIKKCNNYAEKHR